MDWKWDQYFLNIASVVASNSKCLSRQIGAIVVKNNSVIATGYNGPPRGVPHCDERMDKVLLNEISQGGKDVLAKWRGICPRRYLGYESNEGLHLCPATHAEANCIAQAAMNGVTANGSVMYVTCGVPCKNCLALIINAGIIEVVCTSLDYYDELSEFILSHSYLNVREYLKEE